MRRSYPATILTYSPKKVAQALQAAADAAASAQEAKDAAASINPGTYMQKTMYDPENKQKPYIPADEALSLESYGGSAWE